MSEDIIVKHCSPTLAGMKTGNMFSCSFADADKMRDNVRHWNLIRKLEGSGEFPHEIGLFSGYPPGDVRGFIENRARGCKLTGYWKVYGNEENARVMFAKYKKCTAKKDGKAILMASDTVIVYRKLS